jgi:hypothetical protein
MVLSGPRILGSALLLNGQPDRAEALFRADLEQYPEILGRGLDF